MDKHVASGKMEFLTRDVIDENASGNFIFQNYHQATEKIETNSKQLVVLASKLNTTSEDYESEV